MLTEAAHFNLPNGMQNSSEKLQICSSRSGPACPLSKGIGICSTNYKGSCKIVCLQQTLQHCLVGLRIPVQRAIACTEERVFRVQWRDLMAHAQLWQAHAQFLDLHVHKLRS